MKTSILLAAAAMIAVLPAAADDNNLYANVGYTHIFADDANFGAIGGRLGYNFSESFAVEGEANFGVLDETVNVLGTDIDLGLKQEFGVYVVGKMPVSDQFDMLGRFGYVNAEIEASGGGVSVSEDDSALAYGVAGEFNINESSAIRVGATGYGFDGLDAAVDVSYVVKF